MFKMKKTLCVIIAIVIGLSSMAIVSFGAVPNITMVADKTSVNKGDTVTVTVKVADNSGLCSAILDLVYDNDFFKLLSMESVYAFTSEDSGFVTTNKDYAVGRGRYTIAFMEELEDEAVLFTARFEVKKLGGKISLEASEVYMSDNILQEVTGSVSNNLKNVSITVICPHTVKTTNIVADATCYADGKKEEVCDECGEKTEITLEKLPHELKDFVTKEATCEETGTMVQQCSKCDYISETKEIPAKGHAEGVWVVTKLPTTETAGLEEKKCPSCGKVFESREIPMILEYKLGDVNDDGYITAVDARCILLYVAGLDTLEPAQMLAADINLNGEVTAVDARTILQYVAGLLKF